MGIGPRVRRLLGRLERPAAELYRSVFVDLDSFVASIRSEVDTPPRILEIGCGEGCIIERLAHTFRDASITGIDISAQPGRLCTVKEPRIRFLETTAAQMAAAEPASYPLVIIGDVLHHVPRTEREGLLKHAAMLLAPGGVLIFKEWVRQRTLAYLMGYCADKIHNRR